MFEGHLDYKSFHTKMGIFTEHATVSAITTTAKKIKLFDIIHQAYYRIYLAIYCKNINGFTEKKAKPK